MKDTVLAGLAAISLCLVIPVAVTKTTGQPYIEAQAEQTSEQTVFTEAATEAKKLSFPSDESFDESFTLPVLHGEGIQPMKLQTYLIGAVLGEMPASFEPEALQAQAIACRTYVLRRYSHRKHDAAAVCTASSCCLKWTDSADYSPEEAQKVADAVKATDGDVVVYEDELIDATFFSCSGGITEAAAAVWGSDFPYLQAVYSPGEENATHYTDTVKVDIDTFRETLLKADEETVFSDKPEKWVEGATYTEGSGVESISIAGGLFTGKQLRKLFHLNSTNFTLTVQNEAVFTTKGFGHRVGMSQYGANAMAQQGKTAEDILRWYYTGTDVKKLPRFSPEQPSW